MNLTEQEISKLKTSKSETEWNDICDEIKKARDGDYPPDWYDKVLLTGLMSIAKSLWQE